jgi:hypothetical protein
VPFGGVSLLFVPNIFLFFPISAPTGIGTPGVFLAKNLVAMLRSCDVRPEVVLAVSDGSLGASGRTVE